MDEAVSRYNLKGMDHARCERYDPNDVMHLRMPWNTHTLCGVNFAPLEPYFTVEHGKYPTCLLCIGAPR